MSLYLLTLTKDINIVDINKFSQELICKFKDRTYSVRDNGSVYRHQKEGSRPAPLDNKWTFGKKDAVTGYMMTLVYDMSVQF